MLPSCAGSRQDEPKQSARDHRVTAVSQVHALRGLRGKSDLKHASPTLLLWSTSIMMIFLPVIWEFWNINSSFKKLQTTDAGLSEVMSSSGKSRSCSGEKQKQRLRSSHTPRFRLQTSHFSSNKQTICWKKGQNMKSTEGNYSSSILHDEHVWFTAAESFTWSQSSASWPQSCSRSIRAASSHRILINSATKPDWCPLFTRNVFFKCCTQFTSCLLF